MACREQGPCPDKPVFYILNMDTQDRQDEMLWHGIRTGSMIGCVFVENLSVLRGPSRTPFESLPTPWNPFADSSFAFVDNPQLFQISRAPVPHDGADHTRVKQMNTNRHEDRWTCFNDNWRQNASALLSRWCDPVMGGSPPGSAGVPPAQILPQLRPSPPPESTGSGALPLLRPGPCGSRRQGGRLQHRRETERQPKGQHAGGTPALPGGGVPMVRWGVSGGRLL